MWQLGKFSDIRTPNAPPAGVIVRSSESNSPQAQVSCPIRWDRQGLIDSASVVKTGRAHSK